MQYNLTKEEQISKGIYKITNLINGDFYIGSTLRTFHVRYANYKSSYKRYKEGFVRAFHPYLFNAFDKYGHENFEYSVVEVSTEDKNSILLREEYFIAILKPVYNICKRPSRGGSPNSGRKLSKEWKQKIAEKSKLYKHTDNKEVYDRVIKKNKDTSSIYKVSKEGKEFTGSFIDCCNYIGIEQTRLHSWFSGKTTNNEGWSIERLKTQKKKIKVKFETGDVTFNSFGECDRYLNMWRGYTSTKTLRDELLMDKYEYEIT